VATDEPRLYIALYTDADVNGRLAGEIRAKGFDAVSAYEVGNGGLNDPEQFEIAINQKRAIVTHNARDFEPLFREYAFAGKVHFGLIVSEKLPVGEMLRRLLSLLDLVSADEMKNGFRNLGEFK
jgi:hypothetical protein